MINAYRDLYEKYEEVKHFLNNKIEYSNDFLESIKHSICEVEMPEIANKNMWHNINNLLEVLNSQKLRIAKYIKDYDCSDDSLKTNPVLLNIKVVEYLLTRYTQDVDLFFKYSMNDFFHTSINDEEYSICKDIFLEYKSKDKGYKEILKEMAFNMKDPEYVHQHNIPHEVAETLLTGARDKMLSLGVDISDFLDFDL